MVAKINLEQACDKLNWEFIRNTLLDVGLPDNMVQLIQCCFSTFSMRVLQNGEVLEEFNPSRGIHQGHSLSPYLFMLYIEWLFQLFTIAMGQGVWHFIHLCRQGTSIIDLAFSDDIIFFAEATVEQVHIMKHILDLFCKRSAQKISLEKSWMYFS